MADNSTKIVITAETAQAERGIKQVSGGLGELGGAAGIAQSAIGAIGGAVSVGAIAALAKQTIDAADAMNDLAQRTQIPLAELAKYRLAADQSGTSIEAIAKGVKSLSTFMVENGKALRDAGVKATDADGAFRELADVFKQMPDGVEKSALATKLFGKSGQELIPILNAGGEALDDWAKKSERYSQALQEMAPKADEFNDHLAELKINLQALSINALQPMMEGLNGLARFLNDAAAGGERLASAMAFLAERGKTPELAKNAPIFGPLSQLRDYFSGQALRVQEGLSERAGTIRGASGLLTPEFAARLGMGSRAGGGIGTDTADSILARLRTNVLLGGKGDTGGRAAAVKKEADTWKEFADAIKRAYDNALAWEEAGQLIEKQALEQAKAFDALNEASETQARNLETQLENYGLTEGQIQRVIIARLEEARSLTDPAFAEHLAFLDREIEARTRLANAADSIDARRAQEEAKRAVEAAAEESRRQWERITDDINRSLTDAIFDGGKSGGKMLEDYFRTLVLRPIVQMATQPIANAVGSVFGGNSGSGMSFPGGGGSLFNSFATSSLGQSLGLSESMAGFAFSDGASMAAAGAQLTGAGSAIGAALPWIGGALALGSMAGLFEDDGPAQRRGNFRSGFGLSTGVGPGDSNNAIDATEWFSGAEMNASLNEFQKQVAANEKAIIEALGLSGAQQNRVSAALYAIGDRRYGFGMEGTDWRQSGAAEAIIADRMQVIAETLGMSLADINSAVAQPLSTLRNSFRDLFETDAERSARQASELAAQFKKLGVEMPATRAAFEDLVEGSTGKLERGLLRLAPAADAFFDGAEAAAAAAAALADEQARVAAETAAAIAATGRSLDIAIMRARGDTAGATAAERADALAALDPTLRARQELLWQLEDGAVSAELAADAQSALTERYREQASALRTVAGEMSGFADNLTRFRASLGLPGATSETSYAAARAMLGRTGLAAAGGDADALQSLPDSVTRFLDAAQTRARDRLSLARDQALAGFTLDTAIANAGQFAAVAGARANGLDGGVSAQIEALRAETRAQALASVTAQQQLLKLMQRWDGVGMPETRAA